MPKRVFISATSNRKLDDRRKALKLAILEELRSAGLEPQEFFESGIPENLAWTFENVNRVMKQCVGAVVLGFPRWTISEPNSEIRLVGDFNHYEGAVALTHGLPVFLLAERGVENRGVVWTGGGRILSYIPHDAAPEWIKSPEFLKRFNVMAARDPVPQRRVSRILQQEPRNCRPDPDSLRKTRRERCQLGHGFQGRSVDLE